MAYRARHLATPIFQTESCAQCETIRGVLQTFELDHLPFRGTTHTNKPTTTMTSKIGPHTPPYPPIQPPPPHMPPFIMLPFCAEETPVANRGTVPTVKARKVFINAAFCKHLTWLWRRRK